jgi:hypothetical protein
MLRQEAWSAPFGVLQGELFEPFIIFPPLCIAVVMMKWLLVTAASVALAAIFCPTNLNLYSHKHQSGSVPAAPNKQGQCHGLQRVGGHHANRCNYCNT